MPSPCLIKQVSNHFVRFWSDDCPTIKTKLDVISSSAPCSCFRVMDISTCPTLVCSCCTHCGSKTVCQSTMPAHGLNILYSRHQFRALCSERENNGLSPHAARCGARRALL